MYCNQCGRAVQPGQPFCAACGRPVAAAMYAAPGAGVRPKGRVEQHIGVVAALWVVVGALTLFAGFFMMAMSNLPITRFFTPDQQQTIPFEQARNLTNLIQGLLLGFAIFFVAHATASFLAAYGLIHRQPWARTLTLILAFLGLLSFPFGTALGIYTIWVLLAGNAEHEYQRLVARGAH